MDAHVRPPGMRRKSSAQNLLSLAATSNSGPVNPPTPVSREWDSTSQADSPSGGQQQGSTSVEYLRDLAQKRIITLTYLRSIFDGNTHWFHTIRIARADLDREFPSNAPDIKRRTARFAVLAMSLSGLLDIHAPADLLRGLINALSEYDAAKDRDPDDIGGSGFTSSSTSSSSRSKAMRGLLPIPGRSKSSTKIQRTPGADLYSAGADTDASSYLVAPHMPFALDYHQTLLSLLDVLSEVYNKIAKILGPSPFPHAPHTMIGPLGLLSPHPGVSYIFTGLDERERDEQPANSLWAIANAGIGGTQGSFMYSTGSGQVPGLAEMVLKIDGKFKKITSMLLKELDQFARNGIKDELASLDPLLRNINVRDDMLTPSTGGRVIYDFEG